MESNSTTRTLAVDRGSWEGLPADVAAMVAPPVTVTSFPAREEGRRPAREARLRRNMSPSAGYARRRSV